MKAVNPRDTNEATTRPPTLAELRAGRSDILNVATAHRVANVRVFGSEARGENGAGDLDVLVDLPEDARGFHAFGVLDELRRALETFVGCKGDVITLRGPFSPKGAEMARRIGREAQKL